MKKTFKYVYDFEALWAGMTTMFHIGADNFKQALERLEECGIDGEPEFIKRVKNAE